MKKLAVFVFSCLICAISFSAHAQVAPSAYRGQMSLTAGGFASAFQPNYAGAIDSSGNAAPSNSPLWLVGFGVYGDVKFTRWFGAEGEMRWMRLNTFAGINEDNYLVGPRVPIHEFKRLGITPYGKALFGIGRMNFQYNEAYGRFADIAVGGGVDLKLSRHWSLRAADVEYQLWPNWVNNYTLKPYGVSAGIGYKIF
jgi:hypothetical protein